MSETRLLIEWLGEGSVEEWERASICATENVNGGNDKQLEGDHGGDGIAREAEHGFVAATAKHGGLAGTNGDGVEIKFSAQAVQNGLDQVVFAHGDPAGKDEHVFAKALLDFGGKVVDAVECVDERNGFATGQSYLRAQRDGVAVANVKRSGRFGDGNNFVAGGENGDSRFLVANQGRGAHLPGYSELGETEAQAGAQREIAGVRFTAAWNDVLAGMSGTFQGDGIPGARREFDHDDGVSARRNGRSSHDLDTCAWMERLGHGISSFDFADAAELCALRCFARSDGVAISGGTVKRGILAVGVDFLRQDVAESVCRLENLGWTIACLGLGLCDDKLTGGGERKHAGQYFSGGTENQRKEGAASTVRTWCATVLRPYSLKANWPGGCRVG